MTKDERKYLDKLQTEVMKLKEELTRFTNLVDKSHEAFPLIHEAINAKFIQLTKEQYRILNLK